MAASRNRHASDLKKRFALKHGLSDRAARRHFNDQSSEWQEFEKSLVKSGEASAVTVAPTEVILPRPEPSNPSDPKEKRMMQVQWETWEQSVMAQQEAIREGQHVAAYGFGQGTIKAMDAFYKSKAAYDAWLIANRGVFPMSEFLELLNLLIRPVATKMRNIAFNLGPIMNPNDMGFAIKAGNEYVTNILNPEIDRMINGLEAKLSKTPTQP